MCKRCNLDLYGALEEAIPIAAADNFEYEIEQVLDHLPAGPRRTDTGLRNKKDYECCRQIITQIGSAGL
jgi:hypothetical protein